MFANQNSYYFATIRNTTVAFGSLFNNIKIQRFDDIGNKGNVLKTIQVPLMYSAGQKWYTIRTQKTAAQTELKYKTVSPAIGFELTGLQYDSTRKITTIQPNRIHSITDVNKFLKQLSPSPYNYTYDVNIVAKNMNDMLQIIEQILPNFQPSYNLTIKDIPEMDITRDVKVIFGGISMQDAYEGNYDEDRVLIWSLSFTVQGYLYPPIKDSNIIRRVIVDINKDRNMENISSSIITGINPEDASIIDDWESLSIVYDESQLDSNGDPII